jgi:hypothetical protein
LATEVVVLPAIAGAAATLAPARRPRPAIVTERIVLFMLFTVFLSSRYLGKQTVPYRTN